MTIYILAILSILWWCSISNSVQINNIQNQIKDLQTSIEMQISELPMVCDYKNKK